MESSTVAPSSSIDFIEGRRQLSSALLAAQSCEQAQAMLEYIQRHLLPLLNGSSYVLYDELIKWGFVVADETDCSCDTSDLLGQWIHANHYLVNLVIWEILASVPGLLEKLARQLHVEIALQEAAPQQAAWMQMRGAYVWALQTFLCRQPAPEWFTTN